LYSKIITIMNIDYENGELQSKTVWFRGETDEGKGFTIMANWNDWDDWNVTPDEITFDDEELTDDECQQIVDEFLAEMNS
jgi:hypothetical protein